jgi:septal ring factor EnvC (AmiA/AmiB activator)
VVEDVIQTLLTGKDTIFLALFLWLLWISQKEKEKQNDFIIKQQDILGELSNSLGELGQSFEKLADNQEKLTHRIEQIEFKIEREKSND